MTNEEFEKKLLEFDSKDSYENYRFVHVEKQAEIKELINSHFASKKKAVLGIDIYEYSQFATDRQILLPVLLDLLIREATRWCKSGEPLIFKGFDFDQPSIDTGDGGFFLFDSPIQAIVFNIKFYTLLKTYNSGHLYPSIRNFIGEIVLRTCLTYDLINYYKNNIYGSAIINNARILSKDKLNRFMIDHNSFDWFNLNTGGIENLKVASLDKIFPDLPVIPEFTTSSAIFCYSSKQEPLEAIQSIHVQKVGVVQAKKQSISVYNVELQVFTSVRDEENSSHALRFIVSIGNLNADGII